MARGGTRKSLKLPKEYDALRRKGMPKSEAAAISNADANGTLKRARGKRKK